MAHDLHVHTNRSDGSHDPVDLVEYAAQRGVEVLAITDHDTLAGVAEAQSAGGAIGVEIIPGIELSIKVPHGSMHLLGYFPDAAPEPLAGLVAGFGEKRVERAREMVARLNDMGVPLDWQDLLDGAAGAPLGRPHIAEALMRAGHVSERRDAFDLYLGDGRPAYVGSGGLGVEEGVTLVRESGGAPVLAHPYTLKLDDVHLDPFVGRLARAGLAGIEVHRPEYSPDQFATYAALARKYGLIASGGSDYHRPTSPHHPGATGDPPLPKDTVDRLMAAALG
ncbi:MAG: PHP domain-containing protein [Actinobacteria bacterium]|nr:PHP domain-containing protein [Actinomycetota bacterium]MBM3697103.1 PHP domain-containing protein [Actinomycetota bacterium]